MTQVPAESRNARMWWDRVLWLDGKGDWMIQGFGCFVEMGMVGIFLTGFGLTWGPETLRVFLWAE